MQPAPPSSAAPWALHPGASLAAARGAAGLGLLVLGVVLLHLPYVWPGGPALRPWGLRLPMEHDEATVIYDAYRILEGELPYRDFFNFKGPVFGLLFAGVFAVFGPHWAAAQVVWIVIDAITMGLLAWMLARLSGRGVAVGVVLLVACVVVPFWPRPYEQWLGQTWVIGATALLFDAGDDDRLRLLGAGALLALAALTVQSIGIPAAIAGTGLVLLRALARRRLDRRPPLDALRAPAWLVLGIAVAGVVVLAPFAFAGALDELYEQAWLWPRRAYAASQVWPYANGVRELRTQIATLPAESMRLLARAFVLGVTWLPYLAVGLTSLWGLLVLAPGRLERLASARFLVIMMAGASAAHLAYPGINRDITHLAFVGGFVLWQAGASLGALPGGCTGRREEPPDGRRARKRATGAATLGLGGAGLVLYGYLLVHTWSESRELGTWAEATRKRIAPAGLRLAALPDDARILYGGFGPGYVYFHYRRGATPLTNYPYHPQSWPNYYSAEQYAWMAATLRRQRPEVLVVSPSQRAHLRSIFPELDARYRPVGSAGGLLVLELVGLEGEP